MKHSFEWKESLTESTLEDVLKYNKFWKMTQLNCWKYCSIGIIDLFSVG
jgi:hypothetical protein